MPRFFFNFRDEKGFAQDFEGEELADIEAARLQAVESVKELIGDMVETDGLPPGLTYEVMDDRKRLVLCVPFHEVLIGSGAQSLLN